MSLRIEQNWKWSNKTFPHTYCAVSTSDETTHCGMFDFKQKRALGIRGEVWVTNCIFGDNNIIFSLTVGVLLGKYFRKETNS